MPQDFSGQNLRGRSFKGQNLEGADFSHTDIRGANFTGANLQRANFSKAKSGLQKRWVMILILISLLLIGIFGLLSILVGFLVSLIFDSNPGSQIVGWFNLIINIAVIIIIIRKGINTNFTVVVAAAFAFTLAFAFVLAFAVAVVLVIAAIDSGSGRIGLSGTAPPAKLFAGTVVFLLLGIYVVRQAMKGSEKYALVRSAVIAFASFGGTSYRNTNLNNANFSHAILKGTDFRGADLTRTYFQRAKKLDYARPGSSYLNKLKVVQVLATGQGQNLDFDRQDLRGVNFQGAYLQDASFIGADLSNANLQDTDLSRAKLVQTQLDGTDFTGATLTGAYIGDWNITSSTNFAGLRCEYVYMRQPTAYNPDPYRKPDNREEVFGNGQFGDFIKPIFDTFDLYHSQGVDPRAIAISFKQLAENHPDAELEIVAMEKRGEDKFLLRARTATTADKSELSAEYFDTYNQIKGLPEREIRLLLSEKDNQILRLENMVMTALERPNFYSNTQVGTVSTMTSNPGGFSVGGSVGGDVNNVQGNKNRTIQGDNNQGVLGDNNQVTQQSQVGGDASLTKDDVVKLLAQLQTLVKGAELPAETKEEVIEDLDSAKKATDKEEPNKNRALERLGSVAETLEKTSKGVDAGQKIWTTAKPIIVKIATWLGAAAGSHLLGL